MRDIDLPSPAMGAKGHHLRRLVAQIVSDMQVSGPNYTTGAHPGSAVLAAFFTAAAAAATETGLQNAAATFTPTLKTYSIATGAGQAGPTLAKGGSSGAVNYVSSDPTIATVVAGTGAVTPIKVGTCTITVTIAADATYRAKELSYAVTVTA